MGPFYSDDVSTLYHADCLELMATLPANSIDACVTDGPYGIGFMGKKWDTFTPGAEARRIVPNTQIESDNPNLNGRTRSPASSPSAVEYDYSAKGLRAFQAFSESWAKEMLRVLKPGAHVLSCGAPRSYHRMACGLEDAGFEIRDCLAWLFGSGFPKSLNLGEGLGTALKPAHEPIVLARKPFKVSVTANVAKHGTGALNIDACRIAGEKRDPGFVAPASKGIWGNAEQQTDWADSTLGRWPANVCLDDLAALVLDEQSGELVTGSYSGERNTDKTRNVYGAFEGTKAEAPHVGSVGGASRFYYVAKPSREERDMGCYDVEPRQRDDSRKDGNPGGDNPRNRGLQKRDNFHPTVKPVKLMRWLVRLVTPDGGLVIDPFMGSGTTGMACRHEHKRFVGIERELDYIEIARRRVSETPQTLF